MNVIIVGGGKVGFNLANTLLEHGHTPGIIEIDKAVCAVISNELDIPVFHGDGTYIEILESAGAKNADALISVTGQDEKNLIACQLGKKIFNIKKTVARVNNPKNVKVMRTLGVDMPVSTTTHIARLLEREVDTAAIKQLLALGGGEASLSEIEIPGNYQLHGVRLDHLKLPVDSIIVTVTRNGELIIPRGNTQLFSHDKLIIICKSNKLHELAERLCLTEDE